MAEINLNDSTLARSAIKDGDGVPLETLSLSHKLSFSASSADNEFEMAMGMMIDPMAGMGQFLGSFVQTSYELFAGFTGQMSQFVSDISQQAAMVSGDLQDSIQAHNEFAEEVRNYTKEINSHFQRQDKMVQRLESFLKNPAAGSPGSGGLTSFSDRMDFSNTLGNIYKEGFMKTVLEVTGGVTTLLTIGNWGTGEKIGGIGAKVYGAFIQAIGTAVNGLISLADAAGKFSGKAYGAYRDKFDTDFGLQMNLRNSGNEAYYGDIRTLAKELSGSLAINEKAMLAGGRALAEGVSDGEAVQMLLNVLPDYAYASTGEFKQTSDTMDMAGWELARFVTDLDYSVLEKIGVDLSDSEKRALAAESQLVRAAFAATLLKEEIGGLAESVADSDMSKIDQLGMKMEEIWENTGNRLQPALTRLAEALLQHMPQAENVMLGIADAISTVINKISSFLEGGDTFGGALANGIKQAVPPLGFVIDTISFLISLVRRHESETGTSSRNVSGMYLLMAWAAENAGILIDNAMTWAAYRLQTVFNDAVIAVAGFFKDLAINIIDAFTNIGKGIEDFLSNTFHISVDITSGLKGLKGTVDNWFTGVAKDHTVSEPEYKSFVTLEEMRQRLNPESLSDKTAKTAQELYEAFQEGLEGSEGNAQGSGMRNGFNVPGAEETALPDFSSFFENYEPVVLGSNFGSVPANLNNINYNTQTIKDSVDVTYEDLRYLKDLAEAEAINRFTTAEISLDITNNNNISDAKDIDGILSSLSEEMAEALLMSAEGVHV